jgi:hypothetical protein
LTKKAVDFFSISRSLSNSTTRFQLPDASLVGPDLHVAARQLSLLCMPLRYPAP